MQGVCGVLRGRLVAKLPEPVRHAGIDPEYVTGLVPTNVATSLIALGVMLVLATLVFGLSFISLGLMLRPFVSVLFLFGVALESWPARWWLGSGGLRSGWCGPCPPCCYRSSQSIIRSRHSRPDAGRGTCCRRPTFSKECASSSTASRFPAPACSSAQRWRYCRYAGRLLFRACLPLRSRPASSPVIARRVSARSRAPAWPSIRVRQLGMAFEISRSCFVSL